MFSILLMFVAAVAWPYFGYPLWLWGASKWRSGKSSVAPGVSLPSVTLVVSAFNECDVIREKIENALGLAYPPGLIEIMVISDASDDGTDQIVQKYRSQGVVLHRQATRQGKSAGLTRFVPAAKGQILLFTDANAIFEPDAVLRLVERFRDPQVGYVVGQQKYIAGEGVGQSEGLYWRYETWIKKQESLVDSVVGGDGAIYAIRKELFSPLRHDDINDFVNPLQIIARGYCGVYEASAVCCEHTAGSFAGEFKRKVRIVNRSIRALFRVPVVLNPWRHGLFAFHVISHKLLRWLAVFFMAAALATNVLLVVREPTLVACTLLGMQVTFYVLAILGTFPLLRQLRCCSIPFYFCLANLAAGLGVLTYLFGKRYVTWTPDRGSEKTSGTIGKSWLLLLYMGVLIVAFVLAIFLPVVGILVAVAGIAYPYFVYPLLMYALPKRKRLLPNDWRPTVAVLIPAYNESQWIQAKLENTLQLKYPEHLLSVYVVDDASDDRTASLLDPFAQQINVIRSPERRGKANAVMMAHRKITADLILMTDANVMVESDALEKLVAPLAGPEVGCATGNVRLTSDREAMKGEGRYQSIELSLQSWEAAHSSAVSVDGGFYVIRRDLLGELPKAVILDDFVIAAGVLNQGLRIDVVPEARATEVSCPLLMQELKRRIRLGEGTIQVMRLGCFASPKTPFAFWQFVSHKCFRWATPFLVLVLLVSVWQLVMHTAWLLPAVSLLVALSAVALAGLWLPGVRRIRYFNLLGFGCLVLMGLAIGQVKGAICRPKGTWHHGERASLTASASGSL